MFLRTSWRRVSFTRLEADGPYFFDTERERAGGRGRERERERVWSVWDGAPAAIGFRLLQAVCLGRRARGRGGVCGKVLVKGR